MRSKKPLPTTVRVFLAYCYLLFVLVAWSLRSPDLFNLDVADPRTATVMLLTGCAVALIHLARVVPL
jgi:hypothetical protein